MEEFGKDMALSIQMLRLHCWKDNILFTILSTLSRLNLWLSFMALNNWFPLWLHHRLILEMTNHKLKMVGRWRNIAMLRGRLSLISFSLAADHISRLFSTTWRTSRVSGKTEASMLQQRQAIIRQMEVRYNRGKSNNNTTDGNTL